MANSDIPALVERLRALIPAPALRHSEAPRFYDPAIVAPLQIEAADALESLSAQLARQQAVVEAARPAAQALDDWIATYASDICDDVAVAEAKARLAEGGLLYHVTNIRTKLDKALAALDAASTKEQGT